MLRGGHAGLVAGTVAGLAGPLAFTAAWTIASLRQVGYPVTKVQISGLEAPGARDPWIMMAGFGVLGGSLIAFGWTLGRELGGTRQAGPGPWLMQIAGVLTIAAALLGVITSASAATPPGRRPPCPTRPRRPLHHRPRHHHDDGLRAPGGRRWDRPRRW